MKILIATKNSTKIEGARRAFLRYFKDFEINGIPVSSDVSDEPVNEELYNGARNRIINLKKGAKEKNINADFYLSIESGITKQLGEWLIINMAIIEDKNGKVSVGSSSGFPVPDKYVDEIISSDLGKLMDRIFNEKELRAKQGGVSFLTQNAISRYDLTEQAFVMALTRFINGDIWE